jgi:hypothetical protein
MTGLPRPSLSNSAGRHFLNNSPLFRPQEEYSGECESNKMISLVIRQRERNDFLTARSRESLSMRPFRECTALLRNHSSYGWGNSLSRSFQNRVMFKR